MISDITGCRFLTEKVALTLTVNFGARLTERALENTEQVASHRTLRRVWSCDGTIRRVGHRSLRQEQQRQQEMDGIRAEKMGGGRNGGRVGRDIGIE